MVVGSVIGAGIFLVPNRIANLVGCSSAMLAVWAVAGFLSLFGALAIAELASQYPQAGGLYVFLRESYGRPLAFLYGWGLLAVIQTGNIASLAVALPFYLSYLFRLSPSAEKLVAVGAILVLTAANCLGIRWGALIQNILTTVKVVTLSLMTVLLLLGSRVSKISPESPKCDWTWSSLGLAAIAALWAYEGWHLVTFAGGEVSRPEKNLPRGLIAGMALVLTLYLAANAGYLHVLTVGTIQERTDVAAVSMEAVIGRSAGIIVAAMIVFSMLGAMNGLILTGPRVYYAMARDGLFFRRLASVSSTCHVPTHATLLQGGLAAFMATVGDFGQLLSYIIYAAWIFYALTVASVWKLRRRASSPPFRCPLYPLLGSLFVGFSAYIVLSNIVRQPVESAVGIAIILLGLPVYWIWSKNKQLEGVR